MDGSEGAWHHPVASSSTAAADPHADDDSMNEKSPLLARTRDRDSAIQDYSSVSRFVSWRHTGSYARTWGVQGKVRVRL